MSKSNLLHVHDYDMEFPYPSDPMRYRLRCRCGDTTHDMGEALDRTQRGYVRNTTVVFIAFLLLGAGLIVYFS